MRARTLIWIPFLLSVGTVSWALLIAGLLLLGAVILAPAMADVKSAEYTRNDTQATVQLLDQQLQLQSDFTKAASTDPVLMDRLSSRAFNSQRPNEEALILDPAVQQQDRSVKSLLAESLKPVEVKKPAPLNPLLELTTNHALRPMLIMLACTAICLSFFLGVKYERA